MADREIDWNKLMYDNKDNARMLLYGTCLFLVAGVAYVVMILMWYFVYYKSFTWTVLTYVLLLVAGAVMSILSKRQVTGADRPWLAWVGFFFALGATAGLWVGFFMYFRNLVYYWKHNSMRTYTNIGASQSPDAFGDASMILWSEDTRLDAQRSVGYKSRWDGQIYCAAPIVDSSMSPQSVINYWAIGENCCTARADFTCLDAANPTTRSALVVLEPEDVVRPWMQWAVLGAAYPKYEGSVRLQEATYNTKAAANLRLVQWTRDPIALKEQFRRNADWLCVRASLLFAPFLLIFGCWVAAKHIILPWRVEEATKAEFRPAYSDHF